MTRKSTIRPMARLLAGLCMPAFATAASAQALDEDVVVTAQRVNETQVERAGNLGALGNKAAEDVPFAIKSYNSALILNQQPQTLGQVLENDPSVRTSYGFGNAAEQFVIRGFGLAGDDVGFDGLYGIAPRQLIAPELYESVQVLNGASAFLNGAAPGGSGIGGSVNLAPKRAGADPLTRGTVNYASSAHVGGSFDVARRFGGNGEWGVRINGAARRGDVGIEDEFRSAYVVGGAIDYDNGPLRLSLDLAYQRVHVRHMRPKLRVNGVIPRVPKADVNYGQDWQYTTLRDVFGQFHAEYDVTENATFYAAIGARDGSEKGIYSTVTLTDAVTGAANVSSSYIPRTDNNEASVAGLRVKLAAGGVSHEVNFGGSATWLVNRNAYEFYATSPGLTNIYDPVALPMSATVSFSGGDLEDPFPISRTRLTSAFASDTIGLWDDRILLTAGLRLQTIRTKSYSAVTGQLTDTYDEDAVTPVFGLIVKPVSGVSLYANRIEGLVQGATAPISGANPSGGDPLPVSNAGQILSPFTSKQYEVGGKYSTAGLTASLALFQIDRETSILRIDGDRPGFLEFGPFGIQRNRGIELSMEAEPTHGLRIIAGGTVIDAKMRRTQNGVNQGNDAIGVPEYLVNANAEWDLPFIPALTLTGRIVQTGKQAASLDNSLYLSSWTRFDIGARYVAVVQGKPVTFRILVDNVANKRYWASAFDAFRPDLLQGTPRTFKLSVSTDL
ncbi:TonB-dependent receptor [Sphingomonas sp.]|uniref:TonB-dependent receptor n=1 Tax=Sphingomonas sp. TaxID=28214 RepID=UPI003B3B4B4D